MKKAHYERANRSGWFGRSILTWKSAASKEFIEERRRFIRNAGNLVCCLTIEFEIEFGFGAAVIPVRKRFELASPQAPLRERDSSDGDAHARRLSGDPVLPGDRLGRDDEAASDQTWAAFVLACEDEDCIAFGDLLAAVHCFLRAEREHLGPRVANLGFDRKDHFFISQC